MSIIARISFRFLTLTVFAFILLAGNAVAQDDILFATSYYDMTETEIYEIRKISRAEIQSLNGQDLMSPPGPPGAPFVSADDQVRVIALDIKNEFVYWAEAEVFDFSPSSSVIKRSDFSGDNIETLATATGAVVALAVDSYNRNRLYFAVNGASTSSIQFIDFNESQPFTIHTWQTFTLPSFQDGIVGLVHRPSATAGQDTLIYALNSSSGMGEGAIFEGTHSADGMTEGSNAQIAGGLNIGSSEYGVYGLASSPNEMKFVTMKRVFDAQNVFQVDNSGAIVERQLVPTETITFGEVQFAFDPINPKEFYFAGDYFGALVLGFSNLDETGSVNFRLSSVAEGSEIPPLISGVAVLRTCSEDNGMMPDTDSDGTPDCSDLCPFQVGEDALQGCPCTDTSDTDNDGVRLCEDACPDETGLPEFSGCACEFNVDTDNDGIKDCVDQCPLEAGSLEENGCPCSDTGDADGDGIRDCEEEPGEVLIPTGSTCDDIPNGSFDSDSDGEENCVDLCPLDRRKQQGSANVCGCNVDESLAPECDNTCENEVDLGCGCGISPCFVPLSGPLLTPDTRLNSPPIIVVNQQNKSATITLMSFFGAETDLNSIRRRKLKVRYEVIIKRLKRKGGREIQRKVTRKSVVRLTRLKKGIYHVKYRAMAKSTKRTVTQTNFSPSASFTIF